MFCRSKIGLLVVAAGLCCIAGCIEPEKKQRAADNPESVKLITTGVDLVPALAKVDSLAVLYYTDPFGGEAERYTRFYTQYDTKSDSLLALLKSNLSKPFTEDSLRKCRSEGKIFCFSGGKPVQVIYFTHQNENCHHLYFIHTARYYYFKPDEAFEKLLFQSKAFAREP